MSVFLRKEILLYAIALRHSFRNRQRTSCSSCQKLEDAPFRERAFAPHFIAHEWRSCSHNSQVRAAVRYLACLLRSLAKALGYTDAIKALLAEPRFTTMEELETIHKDKNRKKGRNVFNK